MPGPDPELVGMMVIALVMAYHADEYLAECSDSSEATFGAE